VAPTLPLIIDVYLTSQQYAHASPPPVGCNFLAFNWCYAIHMLRDIKSHEPLQGNAIVISPELAAVFFLYSPACACASRASRAALP
jgi:hypothetical protein